MDGSAISRLAVVARGCRGDLTDAARMSHIARHAVEDGALCVVAETTHVFVPHGLTVALLLAQSHLVISTWPEHGVTTVDIAVCANRRVAETIWQLVRAHLQPTAVEIQEQTIVLPESDGRED